MHVADWLRSLGLEQYEPAFRANEIDDKVLPRLTAEDLKELGVTVVGHRRRLLDAHGLGAGQRRQRLAFLQSQGQSRPIRDVSDTSG
jgi:hypothetical protein